MRTFPKQVTSAWPRDGIVNLTALRIGELVAVNVRPSGRA
jgi:hypothetical protein